MCPEHKNLIGGTQPRMPGVTTNKVRQKGLTGFKKQLLSSYFARHNSCELAISKWYGVCVELRTAMTSSVSFRNIRTADPPKRARACSHNNTYLLQCTGM